MAWYISYILPVEGEVNIWYLYLKAIKFKFIRYSKPSPDIPCSKFAWIILVYSSTTYMGMTGADDLQLILVPEVI